MAPALVGLTPAELALIPISEPPSGVVANFTNPVSRAHEVQVTAGVCIPVILLFVTLRVYAKVTIQKRMACDDYVCILAFMSTCAFIALLVACVSGSAFGHHAWDVTLGEFTDSQLRLSLLIETLYGPVIFIVKVSLFLLLLELFSPFKWMVPLTYFGMVFLGLFYMAITIVQLVLCAPSHDESWIAAMGSSKCNISKEVGIVAAIVSIVGDFYLLLLPLPAIWRLQLATKRKIGLSAIFLTGFIACVCSILHLIYVIRVNNSADNTWNVVPLWVVNIVEMTAGMIVVCMPATAGIINKVGPSLSTKFSNYGRRLRSRTAASKPTEKNLISHWDGNGNTKEAIKINHQRMSGSQTTMFSEVV